MFGLFFTDSPSVTCFQDVQKCDVERFKRFFHAMLAAGIYLAPSAYEACFMSLAHGDAEIRLTLEAAAKSFAQL
ncbi:hypothetical protein BG74_04825 [Sodalis-like endosymbiont of Proechinophthirus fluctus]|nr:hypothetical protein BG74_04825 [Sodalis-like endosymbiont of Proechinophthirus fluctus]